MLHLYESTYHLGQVKQYLLREIIYRIVFKILYILKSYQNYQDILTSFKSYLMRRIMSNIVFQELYPKS